MTACREEEGTNLVSKRNLELTIPHLHIASQIEDGEYAEELPHTPKGRKPRKSVPSSQVRVVVSASG